MSVETGLYIIRNAGTGTVVDLSNGSSANGTLVQGWQQAPFNDPFAYDQFWFIQPVPGSYTFTISNLRAGTVLELSNGGSANGTQAQGWARVTDSNNPDIHNQEWAFTMLADDSFRIVNVRSETALDLSNGNPANGTRIQGWQIDPLNPNQHWLLEHRTTPQG